MYTMKELKEMTVLEYLDSLIAGINMGSSIPVQLSELEFLRKMIIGELKL